MKSFADTSFLFAFYFPRAVSEQAIARIEQTPQSPVISPLVQFEFRQAVWFKVWLFANGQPLGVSQQCALAVLAAFELDLEQGVWRVEETDFHGLLIRAEALVVDHTPGKGARAMDIMHIAAALEAGAEELLSFDRTQIRIAQAEGLKVSP